MWTAIWRIFCGPTLMAMQLPLALRVAVIFVAASGSEATAAAEDLAVCFKAEGDAAVSACTAAITSGKHQATDLAIAHIIRGNAYIKGQLLCEPRQCSQKEARLRPGDGRL